MRMRLVWIGLLLGCGGGDDGNKGISINADVSNVCDEIAEVACHNMYQCCAEGEIEDFLGVSDPRSEEQCREDVRRRCDRAIAPRELGLAEGRLSFDARIMNACLEALIAPEDTCATIAGELPWSDACADAAWVGRVAYGAKCLSTMECAASDALCSADEICTPPSEDGEPCGTRGCATGSFCELGVCTAQLEEGDGCSSNAECLDGLFCDTRSVLPMCTALHRVGERCTSAASCASGRCHPGTCAGSTQTCFVGAECEGRCANDGSSCTEDVECAPSGTCSQSPSTSCTSASQCGAGNECVFPACLHECEGNVVCADNHVVADYCQGAISDLPVISGGRSTGSAL